MASAKINHRFNFQFSLLEDDDFTYVAEQANDDFDCELWVDDGDGVRVLCNPSDGNLPDWQRVAVTVAELQANTGEYSATFTPLVPRDHRVVVRHFGSARHHALDVQVTTADTTDVSLAVGGSITGLPG